MSKLAILMSIYNGEKYIDKQLESIASQRTSCDISLYIRDDGSTDATRTIIEKWEKILDISYLQGKNCGPARSFWELMTNNKIQADFFAFCDQDDIWDKDKIETAIRKLSGNVHLYACNCRIIDANSNIVDKKRKKTPPYISLETLFVSGFTQGCAMVFTSALREYICSKRISCIPMHDVIVCMYALSYGQIFWDQEPHFSYRFHDRNVVAKGSKNMLISVKSTLKNWYNSKNQMKIVAEELINNDCYISEKTKEFLYNLSRSGKNIRSKKEIYNNDIIKLCEKKALRSFKIRVIMGII